MARVIRVSIVDDHLMLRLGLRSALSTADDVILISEAASQLEAVSILSNDQPDVMVLDLRMSEGGGISLLKQVKHLNLATRFLILSSYATEEEIFQALSCGASGYLTKDVDNGELLQAIRQVAAGGRYLPAHIEVLHRARSSAKTLGPRELEVLRLLVRGLTNREIATVLGTSINTIRNQTSKIFAKLDVADRSEAVGAALQRGLILPSE